MRFFASSISFLVLLGCYFLYGWVFVPLALPFQAEAAHDWTNDDVPREMFEPYKFLFQPGDWETNPDVKLEFLQFGDTIILFAEREIAGNTAILRPCTILMISGESDFELNDRQREERRRQAVILRTPGQAEIEFDGELNLTRLPLPKIKEGRLNGKVTIWSDMKEEGVHDDLLLETEHVGFTDSPARTEITTRYAVEFQLGRHSGEGRALSLLLAADPKNPKSSKQLKSVNFEKLNRLGLVFPEEGDETAQLTEPAPLEAGPLEKTAARPAEGGVELDPVMAEMLGQTAPTPARATVTENPTERYRFQTSPASSSATQIKVNCTGNFFFQASSRHPGWEAIFLGDVVMQRHNPDGQIDTLTGETVQIDFDKKAPEANVVRKTGDQAGAELGGDLGDLEPIKFTALGSEPVGNRQVTPARIVSPLNGGVQIEGDEIVYDIRGGLLTLKTLPRRSPTVALTLQDRYTMTSTTGFSYRMGEENSSFGELKSLGTGDGRMRGVMGEGEARKSFALSWSTMQIAPFDPKIRQLDTNFSRPLNPQAMPLHVKLGGKVHAWMDGFGTMEPDSETDKEAAKLELDLWCDVEPDRTTATTATAPGESLSPFGGKAKVVLNQAMVRPAGVNDFVKFTSEDGSLCLIRKLVINFLEDATSISAVRRDPYFGKTLPIRQVRYDAPANGRASSIAPATVSADALLPLAEPNPVQTPLVRVPPVTVPAAAVPAAGNSAVASSRAPAPVRTGSMENMLGFRSSGSNAKSWYRVEADSMIVNVRNGLGKMETSALWLEHNVRIGEALLQEDKRGQEIVTAETLAIYNPSAPDMVVQIVGAPGKEAVFSSRGVKMSVAKVTIKKAENSIQSDSGGRIVVTPSASQGNSSALQGLGLPTASSGKQENLLITWNSEMHFQGSQITFEGKPDKTGGRVQVKHGDHRQLFCDTLSIELDRVVRIFDDPPGAADPTARSFNCMGSVIVEERQFAEDGTLKANMRGKFAAMSFFPASKLLVAKGDGEMRATLVKSDSESTPAAGLIGRSAASSGSNPGNLTYVYVYFQDRLEGYLLDDRKNVDIYGGVQSLYAPVKSWNDSFDLDMYTTALRLGGVLLECNRLQLIQTPDSRDSGKGTLEMIASEDASIEGDSFFGKARAIKFDQAKQTVIFDGRASLNSREHGNHSMESFIYNVETGAVEMIQFQQMSIGR